MDRRREFDRRLFARGSVEPRDVLQERVLNVKPNVTLFNPSLVKVLEELCLGETLLIIARILKKEKQWNGANNRDPQNPGPRRNTKLAALLGVFLIIFSHES